MHSRRAPARPAPPSPPTSARRQVANETVARLRTICQALPEVIEEQAWVGTRWRIRQQTFAHVLMIDGGRPPAYAQAAGSNGPLCVLTFRSPLPPLDAHVYTWDPFFRPRWFATIVGMRLDEQTDWAEVQSLIQASWRLLAPQKLAAAWPPAA